MATVVVEAFTDPFSPWCWAAQPTLRRLRYAFDDVTWTPRMTVLLPAGSDADQDGEEETEAQRDEWARVAGATGMPVAEPLWPDGLPRSRPACETVALVRTLEPGRTLRVLRRLRVAVFAEGRAVEEPDELAALAGEVEGVDEAAVRRGLDDGRAAEALEADLERAATAAAERSSVPVRGSLTLLPALGRLDEGTLPSEPVQPEDEEAEGVEEEPSVLGPPAIRVEREGTTTLCDARLTYGRLASAFGHAEATTGIDVDDKFAIGRMAMHVPRETAEALSAHDFTAEVAPYLRRFGRAYLPEIVAATGRSPETCVGALEQLVDRGDAERLGPREWRTVDDPGPRGPEP